MKYLFIFQLGGAIGLSTFAGLLIHSLNQGKKELSCPREQAKEQNLYEPISEPCIPNGDPLDYGISRGLKAEKETIKIKSISYNSHEW